jgi:hypothetical protein
VNNKNVISLPATTTYQPEQALASAQQIELTDVLIIGYDIDGDLLVRSSNMTCAEALFLLEKAKIWALSGGQSLV